MKTYAKALTGSLIAALTALGQALDDNTVSGREWVAVALAALTVFAGVWVIPNKAGDPGEEGSFNTYEGLIIATFVGVVLLLFGVRFGR